MYKYVKEKSFSYRCSLKSTEQSLFGLIDLNYLDVEENDLLNLPCLSLPDLELDLLVPVRDDFLSLLLPLSDDDTEEPPVRDE